jgi:hypothetical protein
MVSRKLKTINTGSSDFASFHRRTQSRRMLLRHPTDGRHLDRRRTVFLLAGCHTASFSVSHPRRDTNSSRLSCRSGLAARRATAWRCSG